MTSLLLPKHLTQAVKGLHFRNSLEIHKLLKDNEDFCISFGPEDGSSSLQKVNVEKMVGMLPLHLIAVLMSSDKDDKLKYVLCGIRLLNTFCDLTSRHPKLEQVMLDDVKYSAQMLDLVMLTIISLGGNRKERCNSATESLIDATLVASSLYLMHGFISPNYQDLVLVLLAHPRVDVFIDGVFGAVHNAVRSLKAKLLYRRTDLPKKLGGSFVDVVNIHCQQAEAALQFLQSLCQHKPFRDRIAKNKELCGKGGSLMLAQSILSLAVTPELVGAAVAIASISRMKAKVLSILQHLFEAESVSFLDVVAKAGNLHLAKSIASEVLNLLKFGLSKASKCRAAPDYPMGFVLLNAMRLADVLTDDSNFRSFFTEHFSTVVSAIFCLSHGDFLSMLCSSDISSREDDANVDYDLYTLVGGVLSVFSSVALAAPPFKLSLQNNLTMASYAHQRTALLIKMIANLHCFIPNLCEEEDRNRFVRNFVSGLHKDPSSLLVNMLPCTSYTPVELRGTGVCKNLCSLLRHAESLIPNFVNEEDFMLFRVFCDQSENLIIAQFEDCQVEQTQEPLNLNNEEASENFDVRVEGGTKKQGVTEEMETVERSKESDADASNLETSGSDSSSNRGKSVIDRVEEGELVQNMSKLFKGSGSGGVKEDEKAETFLVFEKQRKRRKRSIMNDDQMGMIEKALADEPDMQRNSASIQLWADKLSQNGSEVITSSQLKNWLNNRKAKLARANKQTGPVRDNNSSGELPESPGDENTSSTPFKDQTETRTEENLQRSSSKVPRLGQPVMLMNEEGEKIARAIVLKTEGEWCGWYLDTSGMCVVDIMELTGPPNWGRTAIPYGSDRGNKKTFAMTAIPYGSDRVGRTFNQTVRLFGHMVVAWDLNKLQY